MTATEKHDLRVWWWGRKLPDSYEHLARLSNNTDEDFITLNQLKVQYEQAQEKGIEGELDWGYQVSVGQVVMGRLA